MGILGAVLLAVLVLEVAGVGLLVVCCAKRSECRLTEQLAEYLRAQELNHEARKVWDVAAAHGLLDSAKLDGTLRDAEALYSVQLGRAPVTRFMEALRNTAPAGGPDVFEEICAYVDAVRKAGRGRGTTSRRSTQIESHGQGHGPTVRARSQHEL